MDEEFFSPKAHANRLKRALRSGLVYDCFAQVGATLDISVVSESNKTRQNRFVEKSIAI